MSKRALVLGGGGTVGVAWETGLAAGLLEHGVNLGEADLFVGTSAGSVVSAQLAAGYDPRVVLELQRQMAAAGGAAPGQAVVTDPETSAKVFARWTSVEEVTVEVRRELGALALAARTIPEDGYVGMIAQVAGVMDWPDRRLLITAVQAETGDFQVWERGSAAPIDRAIASSCCVPGIFPPVTIGGKRYVDGGVRSGTNADLAEGHDVVVVVAPLGVRWSAQGRDSSAKEIAALQAAGARVEVILPDEAAEKAFGPNMMDASRIGPGAEAGYRQGVALAERLQAIWR
ncbi:MAG: Patatin [Symbiobacteriaceae bacterium]|jgi:NTE family protein|nr:Patatin [Symbiobacteriaceae bacterium]